LGDHPGLVNVIQNTAAKGSADQIGTIGNKTHGRIGKGIEKAADQEQKSRRLGAKPHNRCKEHELIGHQHLKNQIGSPITQAVARFFAEG
jgi:hypothetical protein